MKICVIGVGYVGLVTGTGFADVGNSVICVDIDADKVNRLQDGHIPIYEPGLEPLVKQNVEKGRLHFTTDLAAAVEKSDICFIAVGTPSGEDGSTDLQYVLAAARDIAKAMTGYKMIGIKSTVPVGTCDKVRAVMAEASDHPASVFSNPEFLKEGNAVTDFMRPDRIIVGTDDDRVRETLTELYAPFNRKEPRTIFMSVRSAELTKYAANAMLATRISFMNEMANLAEKIGANIEDVRLGIGSDPRIGDAFLFPGIGYGGSCLPKDVKSLLEMAKVVESPLHVMAAVERANDRQKMIIIDKIVHYFSSAAAVKDKRIAVWGLAFKPNTDDIREAPALVMIEALLKLGAQVSVYDPVAMNHVHTLYGDRITYIEDPYDALRGADALIIATEWHDYRSPDVERMKELMNHMVVFDGRNVYAKSRSLHEACKYYWGVGI